MDRTGIQFSIKWTIIWGGWWGKVNANATTPQWLATNSWLLRFKKCGFLVGFRWSKVAKSAQHIYTWYIHGIYMIMWFVHVNLYIKCMLRCGCRLGHVFMGGGWGRVGWGGIITSLALSHPRHATLLYVLLDFHAYVMLRYCMFSWTSTHTSCYATVRSLGLPRMPHATLL